MKIIKSLWSIFFMSTVFSGQEKVIFNPCSLKELACTKAAEYLLQLQQNSTLPTKIQRSLDLPIGHEHTALLKKILASDSIVHKATTRALGRFIPSPDGTKLLTISFQKVVRVIDSVTGKKCLKLPKARFDFIEDAGWSPCGNYLWAYAKTMFLFLGNPKSSHLVRWWDINNCYDPQTVHNANSIHFSSQQKKIILAGLNKLALYDLEKNRFVLCKEFPNYPNGVRPRKKEFSRTAYESALEKLWCSESRETPESVSLGPIDEQRDLMIVYGKEQNYLGNRPIVDGGEWNATCIPRGKALFYLKNGCRKIILEDIDEISLYDIDQKTTTQAIRLKIKTPDHDIDKLYHQNIRIFMKSLHQGNNLLHLYIPGNFGGVGAILDLQKNELVHRKNNFDPEGKTEYTPDLSSFVELRSDESLTHLMLKIFEDKIIADWYLDNQFTKFTQSPNGNLIVLMNYYQPGIAGILKCDTSDFVRLPEIYHYNSAEFISNDLLITRDEKNKQTHIWHLPIKQCPLSLQLEKLTLCEIAAWHVLMNNKIRKQKTCPKSQQVLKEWANDKLLTSLNNAAKN